MSKVKIEGNASGTGTFTITSPDSSTDRTITLPDATGDLVSADASGNVSVTGYVKQAAIPAIHLDGNNSANNSLSSGTVITTSTYMTDSAGHAFSQGGMSWNSTTGAVTVPVDGIYRVSTFVYVNSTDVGRVSIYANGSEKVIINVTSPTTNSLTASGTTILDLAADDYVDLRVASFAAPISIYTGTKHIGFSMEFVG